MKRPRSRSPSPPSPLPSSSSSSKSPQATPPSEPDELWDGIVATTLNNSINTDYEASSTPDNDYCDKSSWDNDSSDDEDADMPEQDKPFNQMQTLRAYHIFSQVSRDMPKELVDFVNDVIKAERTDSGSPSAKNVYRNQLVAVRKNERGGIRILAPSILVEGEALGGHKNIIQDEQATLHAKYLPDPPNPKTLENFGRLAASVPYHILGYINNFDAEDWKVSAPLTQHEETTVIGAIKPVSETLFPFLHAEWKRGIGGSGHYVAALQTVRGAACIVNYNYDFFECAGMVPSILDTIHFTITCDMVSVILYVHWRETSWRESVRGSVRMDCHYSRIISEHLLRDANGNEDNPQMIQFRAQLRNIIDWAIGTRLTNFRLAIDKIVVKDDEEGWNVKRKKISPEFAY